MAKRKAPRAHYTVEEIYGSDIGSNSSSSSSDENEDVGRLRKRNQNLEEEQYSSEVSSTPSGISRNSNVSRRLSMRTPSSQEEVMNNHVTTETEQPALKEVTNLTSQEDTSSAANGSTSARTSGIRTTAETQGLILEELKKANLRLDQFDTNISTLEKRLSSLESSQSLQLTPSSSSSSSAEDSVKKRRKVPSKVSVWCYE